MEFLPDIIAIKGDVKSAVLDFGARMKLSDGLQNSFGKRDTPGLNSDKYGIGKILVVFDQLLGQPLYN